MSFLLAEWQRVDDDVADVADAADAADVVDVVEGADDDVADEDVAEAEKRKFCGRNSGKDYISS